MIISEYKYDHPAIAFFRASIKTQSVNESTCMWAIGILHCSFNIFIYVYVNTGTCYGKAYVEFI